MAKGSSDILFDRADRRSETAKINSERAVAELRYGRPVLLRFETGTVAVLALDCVAPDDLRRFRGSGPDRVSLYLTAYRARSLGLSTLGPVALAIGAADFETVSRLAYGTKAASDVEWRPAPEWSCLADLASLALLLPAFLCRQALPGDPAFAGCLSLGADELREAMAHEARFSEIARTRVPLRDVTAETRFVIFRGGLAQRDQLAIVVGEPDVSRPVPVRIHSSCITGDLFASLKCDCGDQLREGLQLIAQRGGGVLLYLDQEGRGTGLAAKMRAYGLQHAGFDTIDADAELGFEADGRRYGAAVSMLRALGIGAVELLTNNPAKIAALEAAGIEVRARTAVLGAITAENRNYLVTKTRRGGHLLDWPAIAANHG
ncbi:GTP cyclohydrolase II RibA [Aureimonas jatrophae]|uniref:GTP cyclohydrolase-2 n=1 Tax=Aureimonas jatrophae TaxID=1166073 RepID=A0A1H0FFW5_9HYPH|nr:GTP cyclohydrolase II RibA [Aureimonas jatrophae]MBB3950033.1 GTP cyclohydrolase II [Aureimonas jatrophae]SDN93593.1 GTP cyclohydrolase II [Aureimonas jatrophae]